MGVAVVWDYAYRQDSCLVIGCHHKLQQESRQLNYLMGRRVRSSLDLVEPDLHKIVERGLFMPYTLKIKNVYVSLSESTTEMCFE